MRLLYLFVDDYRYEFSSFVSFSVSLLFRYFDGGKFNCLIFLLTINRRISPQPWLPKLFSFWRRVIQGEEGWFRLESGKRSQKYKLPRRQLQSVCSDSTRHPNTYSECLPSTLAVLGAQAKVPIHSLFPVRVCSAFYSSVLKFFRQFTLDFQLRISYN